MVYIVTRLFAPMKKYLLWLGVGFIVYLVIKMFFGDKFTPKGDSESTLSESQAVDIANGLHIAMDKVGTDEEAIVEALKDLTPDDYARVFNAFGLRGYVAELGYGGFFGFETKYSLSSWLKAELDNSYIVDFKERFKDKF